MADQDLAEHDAADEADQIASMHRDGDQDAAERHAKAMDPGASAADERLWVVCASCYSSWHRERHTFCPKCKTEEVLP